MRGMSVETPFRGPVSSAFVEGVAIAGLSFSVFEIVSVVGSVPVFGEPLVAGGKLPCAGGC